MDEAVILSKLESLRRCVERVRSKRPESAQALTEDFDLQDIISVNLERAVQICVDIAAHVLAELDAPAPESMAESFDQLGKQGVIPDDLATRMRKAVGFRNIPVHAYHEIDWVIVFSIVTDRLGDFSAFARCIATKLQAAPNGVAGSLAQPQAPA
jgi:uncharacterized protein YutE (UPF0331/DUF86 family)